MKWHVSGPTQSAIVGSSASAPPASDSNQPKIFVFSTKLMPWSPQNEVGIRPYVSHCRVSMPGSEIPRSGDWIDFLKLSKKGKGGKGKTILPTHCRLDLRKPKCT